MIFCTQFFTPSHPQVLENDFNLHFTIYFSSYTFNMYIWLYPAAAYTVQRLFFFVRLMSQPFKKKYYSDGLYINSLSLYISLHRLWRLSKIPKRDKINIAVIDGFCFIIAATPVGPFYNLHRSHYTRLHHHG